MEQLDSQVTPTQPSARPFGRPTPQPPKPWEPDPREPSTPAPTPHPIDPVVPQPIRRPRRPVPNPDNEARLASLKYDPLADVTELWAKRVAATPPVNKVTSGSLEDLPLQVIINEPVATAPRAQLTL